MRGRVLPSEVLSAAATPQLCKGEGRGGESEREGVSRPIGHCRHPAV